MAEHFYGRHLTVHISSAGAKEMLAAWIALGTRMTRTDDLEAVLVFLQDRIESGAESFTLDPPPEGIRSPQRLVCLARIVAAFAKELQEDKPDLTLTDIDWDRELRLRWIAKMLDLLEIIADLVPKPADQVFRPQLSLSESEQVHCQINRTGHRQTEAERRGAKPGEKIVLVNQVIELLMRLPADDRRDAQLRAAYDYRAELLLSEGETENALADLRRALMLDRDSESRAALSEIISELEAK